MFEDYQFEWDPQKDEAKPQEAQPLLRARPDHLG